MADTDLVVKSNAVIEASYRLTAMEQRLILAAICQVRRDQPVTDQVMYPVSIADLQALVGSKSKSLHAELKDAVDTLYERTITLDSLPNGKGPLKERLKTRWIQSHSYESATSTVKIQFANKIIPYLNQLNSQFTSYALSDVAKLKSAHSYRIYELLVQHKATGKREVSIERLRDWLGLHDKYPMLSDFRRRVIEVAVKQINEHSPLWVKWKQKKSGRRVTHIVFTYGEKENLLAKDLEGSGEGRKKPGSEPRKPASKAAPGKRGHSLYGIPGDVIEREARVGESYEDAALRILDERRAAAASAALTQ